MSTGDAVPRIWTTSAAVPSFFGSLMIVNDIPSRPFVRQVIRLDVPLTRGSAVMRPRTSGSSAAKAVQASMSGSIPSGIDRLTLVWNVPSGR